MIGVAWCTCALLVFVSARIYERCELARELTDLGINQADISTWVCIAFHESRLDTAANNLHSGDHGIFQISEVYWCGKGKACHLPCSALKDDDITDDMECALHIHEEHTRLQGDGFLAWVVYPHHCKHNTKKYIADCDHELKTYTTKNRQRLFNTNYDRSFYDSNDTSTEYVMGGEQSLPAFLVVSSIFRANYGKFNHNKNGRFDWFNYKVDNIDDLKLPVFDKPEVVTIPATTTTLPSITYAPVKPWRVIETNQFRHKNKPQEKSTITPVSLSTISSLIQNTTERATTIESTTFKSTQVSSGYNLSRTTEKPYDVSSTATRFTDKLINKTSTTYSIQPWAYTTTYKPPTIKSTARGTYKYQPWTYTTTYKPPTIKATTRTTYNYQPWAYTTTYKPPTIKSTTRSTYKFQPWAYTTTYKPPTTKSTARATFTLQPWVYTTTYKPLISSKSTELTSAIKYGPLASSTLRTTTDKPTQPNVARTTTARPLQTTTTRRTTDKYLQSTTVKPFLTTSRPQSRIQTNFNESRLLSASSTTKFYISPAITTASPPKFTTASQKIKSTSLSPPTKSKDIVQTTRTTQSIFDLYLNPTKRPKYIPFDFSSFSNNRTKVIFSGGTTANPIFRPAPGTY